MRADPIVIALAAERIRRSWSQQRIGEELGCRTERTVAQWENGWRSPRLDNLWRWARLLGHDVDLGSAAESCPRTVQQWKSGLRSPTLRELRQWEPLLNFRVELVACPNPPRTIRYASAARGR